VKAEAISSWNGNSGIPPPPPEEVVLLLLVLVVGVLEELELDEAEEELLALEVVEDEVELLVLELVDDEETVVAGLVHVNLTVANTVGP
jgi:hypothetical protein